MKLNINKKLNSSAPQKESLENFDKLIFSSYCFTSKLVEIGVDCIEYNDEKLLYPMDSIFEIARDKSYDNALFVLNKNIFNESAISYTPIYTILAERYVDGFECDTMEPLDLFPFKSFEKVKNMKLIQEFIANILTTNKAMARPLSVEGFNNCDFFNLRGRGVQNPFKRKILVLFEKDTEVKDKNMAKMIVTSILSSYAKSIKEILSMQIDDAYIEYLAFSSVNKLNNLSFDEFYKKDNRSYLDMAEKELKKFDFSYTQLPEPVNGTIELKTPYGIKTYAPNKEDKEKFLSGKSIDELINLLYVEPISAESYFGKQKRNTASMFVDNIQAKEEDNPYRIALSEFTKDKLKSLCEENNTYILLTYNISDVNQRKMFAYPDKILTNSEFLSIKNKKAQELSKTRLSDEEVKIKEANRIEALARLEPKNDDEVLDKMMAFPRYDEMAYKFALDCGFKGVNDESFFSRLYGKSFYELCVEPK